MKIAVDTSVWIDYFRGADTAATRMLDSLLCLYGPDAPELLIPDVALMEFLRGFTQPAQLKQANELLAPITVVNTGGETLARKAAHIYRDLRTRGITVRSAMDLLIGAWCIEQRVALLHADRDFDGMATHHGLRVLSTVPAR
ncbi:MAG TPA: PIN domain-containing protein [Ottowia beijingensis]|nr:PIN domain-containing protein [Ottowia beijingensis]